MLRWLACCKWHWDQWVFVSQVLPLWVLWWYCIGYVGPECQIVSLPRRRFGCRHLRGRSWSLPSLWYCYILPRLFLVVWWFFQRNSCQMEVYKLFRWADRLIVWSSVVVILSPFLHPQGRLCAWLWGVSCDRLSIHLLCHLFYPFKDMHSLRFRSRRYWQNGPNVTRLQLRSGIS